MAHIFISHSQHDKDTIHFFLEAFAGTKVKPHLEELESPPPAGIGAGKIASDIQTANAVFVLLSETVESLNHTRDWIAWECGTAMNKDVWVFESPSRIGKSSVVVPRVTHYAVFEHTAEWRNYLREIIASYDDSHVIPTLSAATSGGALLNAKDRATGAAIGLAFGVGALALHSILKPQLGVAIRCENCQSNYQIHLKGHFRCPVCNERLMLNEAFVPDGSSPQPVP